MKTSSSRLPPGSRKTARRSIAGFRRLPGEIDIISIETVGSIEGEQLQAEIETRAADIHQLQAAVEANKDLLNAIKSEEEDFSVESVVAVDMKSDGRLVIYVLGQGASQ